MSVERPVAVAAALAMAVAFLALPYQFEDGDSRPVPVIELEGDGDGSVTSMPGRDRIRASGGPLQGPEPRRRQDARAPAPPASPVSKGRASTRVNAETTPEEADAVLAATARGTPSAPAGVPAGTGQPSGEEGPPQEAPPPPPQEPPPPPPPPEQPPPIVPAPPPDEVEIPVDDDDDFGDGDDDDAVDEYSVEGESLEDQA